MSKPDEMKKAEMTETQRRVMDNYSKVEIDLCVCGDMGTSVHLPYCHLFNLCVSLITALEKANVQNSEMFKYNEQNKSRTNDIQERSHE